MTAIMKAHNSGLQRIICDVSITASWIFDRSECNNFGVSTATSGKKNKTLMNILIGARPLLRDWIRVTPDDDPSSMRSVR